MSRTKDNLPSEGYAGDYLEQPGDWPTPERTKAEHLQALQDEIQTLKDQGDWEAMEHEFERELPK